MMDGDKVMGAERLCEYDVWWVEKEILKRRFYERWEGLFKDKIDDGDGCV
jgi:hypothetical protein